MLVVGFGLLLTSCEEVDPAVQKKYEEQKNLIATSRSELESLQERIAVMEMPDPTTDLKDLKSKFAEASTQKSEFEQKVRELKLEADAAQKKFEEYQLRYPLKPR